MKIKPIQNRSQNVSNNDYVFNTFAIKQLRKNTTILTSFREGGGPTNQLFAPNAPVGTTLAPKGTPERPGGGSGSLQTPKNKKMNLKTIQNQ